MAVWVEVHAAWQPKLEYPIISFLATVWFYNKLTSFLEVEWKYCTYCHWFLWCAQHLPRKFLHMSYSGYLVFCGLLEKYIAEECISKIIYCQFSLCWALTFQCLLALLNLITSWVSLTPNVECSKTRNFVNTRMQWKLMKLYFMHDITLTYYITLRLCVKGVLEIWWHPLNNSLFTCKNLKQDGEKMIYLAYSSTS